MAIAEFVTIKKIVEEKLKKRELDEAAYNIYLTAAKQAEQIMATHLDQPGYTPEDMKVFLLKVYRGLKVCAMQQRNAQLIKDYNTKIAVLGG
ncbi:MAG: hypothetical protein KKH98_07950 [Spirochaetes bacterium]|nr:hypothetical protein [Spirochaetota bacterium]